MEVHCIFELTNILGGSEIVVESGRSIEQARENAIKKWDYYADKATLIGVVEGDQMIWY